MSAGTHKLIAKQAVAFARECWEGAATRSDPFYRTWPDMDSFCRANWPMFVPDVRRAFVEILTLPDEDHPHWRSLPVERKAPKRIKAAICEALCYDGAAKARPKGEFASSGT